jgi:hypothetical protein
MKKRNSFESIMEKLARRYGVNTVFSDFLTLLICAFSHGQKEKEYLETIRRYEKPEAYDFSEALAALVIEMTGDGSGMVDVLGHFYEDNISHGHNGQFFTPQSVCDMMAQMHQPVKARERVADPACGSGRMLMAMGKLNKFALFYGADVDANCAKMSAINLCLNGLFGEIAWMNSLTNQFYAAWEIAPTIKGVPHIRQITEQQSYIHLDLPEEKQEIIHVPGQKSFEF